MDCNGVPNIWVGMPAVFKLQDFGSQVWSAFGEPPYLVGSATYKRDWRDVDVRLILSDEEYEKQGFGHPHRTSTSHKWVAMCLAFSALGREMTGLPIDFQIQQMTESSKRWPKDDANHLIHARIALGIIPLRFAKGEA